MEKRLLQRKPNNAAPNEQSRKRLRHFQGDKQSKHGKTFPYSRKDTTKHNTKQQNKDNFPQKTLMLHIFINKYAIRQWGLPPIILAVLLPPLRGKSTQNHACKKTFLNEQHATETKPRRKASHTARTLARMYTRKHASTQPQAQRKPHKTQKNQGTNTTLNRKTNKNTPKKRADFRSKAFLRTKTINLPQRERKHDRGHENSLKAKINTRQQQAENKTTTQNNPKMTYTSRKLKKK